MYVLLMLPVLASVVDARGERYCKLENQPWVQYCFEPGSFYGVRRCNMYEPEDIILRPGCSAASPHSNRSLTPMRCIDGKWEDFVTCTPSIANTRYPDDLGPVCKLDSLPGVKYSCQSSMRDVTRRCNATEPAGTIVRAFCNYALTAFPPMTCIDGNWDKNITCKPAPGNMDFIEAPQCDLSLCVLPDCFCSQDGTSIPGGLSATNIPQMITITFDGYIDKELFKLYNKIFNGKRKNPNGCDIKATFFVTHKNTNYSAVQELHAKGHEMAVNSITNNENEGYWGDATIKQWTQEMAGMREILVKFANITENSIQGIRTPQFHLGGHDHFTMMEEQAFTYDSSIFVPLSNPPLWPYTLYHEIPHRCNQTRCPMRSYSAWEVVINELDRRENAKTFESKPGCGGGTVESCGILEGFQLHNILNHNFDRHYSQNRAPFGLHLKNTWLLKYEFWKAFNDWIDHILLIHKDVYFVTISQAIKWIGTPHDISQAKNFEPWKVKCEDKGVHVCKKHRSCQLSSEELPGQTFWLETCVKCPAKYPWLRNPNGEK